MNARVQGTTVSDADRATEIRPDDVYGNEITPNPALLEQWWAAHQGLRSPQQVLNHELSMFYERFSLKLTVSGAIPEGMVLIRCDAGRCLIDGPNTEDEQMMVAAFVIRAIRFIGDLSVFFA